MGSLIFSPLSLSSLSTLGSAGVASDGRDSSGDSDGISIVPYPFFTTFAPFFTFFFTFFLGGYKTAGVGVGWARFYLEGFRQGS